MGQQTLEQQARTHNNDCSHLEAIYCATEGELVCDQHASMQHLVPNLTFSASVIIPVWNALGTLEQCLNLLMFRANTGYDMMASQHQGDTYARTTIRHHQLLVAASD